MPRMQVAVGTGHFHFPIGQPAQAGGERRQIGREHASVAHQHDVAGQQFTVLLQEGGQARRADFLLSFQYEFHIMAQLPRTHHVLERLQLNHALPLVVVRTTGIHFSVAHFRFERRTDPQFQRIGRHHVIMPVNQHRGRVGRHPLFGIHQRIARRRHQPRLVSPGLQQQRPPPFGASLHVGLAGRVGTHARNAYQAEPFLQEPGFVGPDIFFHFLFHDILNLCQILTELPHP